MTTNATSGQETSESDTNHQPTSEAAETVHTTDDWALVVWADGAVEARSHWPNGNPQTFTTAPVEEAPEPSATYRYGLSIEQVLGRYTHETRFDRDLNARENGAAFRKAIIGALCTLAPSTFPDGFDGQPIGVVHVNAPTGPSTTLVAEDIVDRGTYATFYPFENANESESATEAGR